MNQRRSVEVGVGLLVILGVLCLAFLSLRVGRLDPPGRRGYPVRAVFSSVAGLRVGAPVEIAGVPVGRVSRVALSDYHAVVTLALDERVVLPDDSIASIRTKGLIGDKLVAITPGASETRVRPDGVLRDTEDAVDIEQLISQYIHGRL